MRMFSKLSSLDESELVDWERRPPRAGAPSAVAVAGGATGHGETEGARRPLEGCALPLLMQAIMTGGAQLVRIGGGIGRGLGGRIFVGGPVKPVPERICSSQAIHVWVKARNV